MWVVPTVTASTMIAQVCWGRKVRCHIGGCGNAWGERRLDRRLIVQTRSLGNGKIPSVPKFPMRPASKAMLDFLRLQSDLLLRIAARDNNVGWFAGTSLDATRLPSHYRIRVRVTVGTCLSTRYVATSGTQSGIVHPPCCDAPPLSAEGHGVHFVQEASADKIQLPQYGQARWQLAFDKRSRARS